MKAARLYGPKDIRIDRIASPPAPGPGEALLRVTATGICGSDLHSYMDARIGDIALQSPLVLGHEFAGEIMACGPGASDGDDASLRERQRVAVDPATPCHRCEFCEHGHPNLCRRLHFCGLWPDDGSLREFMLVPSRSCFPLPDSIDDVGGALLEPLGIALHAVDLARLRVGETAAILGAGPIGLLILKIALLSGAGPVFLTDRLPWRLELARRFGGIPIDINDRDPIATISEQTAGRGVDVVFEAAWGAETVTQSAELACLGGRLILVGIPSGDALTMRASPARRKGLTVKFSRRMKHTYPRALALVTSGAVSFDGLVSHRFRLEQAPEAFAKNLDYLDGIVKAVILG